jgi:hypothetical protein
MRGDCFDLVEATKSRNDRSLMGDDKPVTSHKINTP